MSDIRTRGALSQMVRIFIPDNSVTTGAGCTGLTFESDNLVIAFMRERDSAATAFHEAGHDIENITTIGTFEAPTAAHCRFKAVDATNFPGEYEIHFIDGTAFGAADASNKVQINVYEVTTTALKIGPCMKEIELTALDLQATVQAGAQAALEANGLDHLIKTAVTTTWAGEVTKESVVDLMTSKNSSQTYARATDSLEGINDTVIPALLNTVNTGATYNTANSVGRQIRQGGTVPETTIRQGTCQTGSTATTIKLDAAASATNNIYYGNTIFIDGSTGIGQSRRIVAYNGTTKVCTVDRAWVTTPSATSTFTIVASPISIMSFEGIAAAGGASTVDLQAPASTVNSYYSGFVVLEAGTGAGQSAEITGYTGASRRVSIAPETWAVNPSTDTVVAIIPAGGNAADSTNPGPSVADIASAILTTPGQPIATDSVGRLTLVPAQIAIKKNTAFTAFTFPMVSSADHLSPLTGATVTARRSIDGGAFGACANAVAEISLGFYKITLADTDLNGTIISLLFTAPGGDSRRITVVTQA